MRQLLEYPTEDGGFILVEVEDQLGEAGSRQGVVPVARGPGDVVAKARQSFEEALERVKPIASGLKRKLGSMVDPPDEIEVEFGLDMSFEGGAIVAKGGIGANFKVKLTWSKDREAGYDVSAASGV
jgi:hypothetical protein